VPKVAEEKVNESPVLDHVEVSLEVPLVLLDVPFRMKAAAASAHVPIVSADEVDVGQAPLLFRPPRRFFEVQVHVHDTFKAYPDHENDERPEPMAGHEGSCGIFAPLKDEMLQAAQGMEGKTKAQGSVMSQQATADRKQCDVLLVTINDVEVVDA
jgi:hypothetical protein